MYTFEGLEQNISKYKPVLYHLLDSIGWPLNNLPGSYPIDNRLIQSPNFCWHFNTSVIIQP